MRVLPLSRQIHFRVRAPSARILWVQKHTQSLKPARGCRRVRGRQEIQTQAGDVLRDAELYSHLNLMKASACLKIHPKINVSHSLTGVKFLPSNILPTLSGRES